ncbi:MAG: HAMP domain-containing protein [Oscillospiraceae bacterium]|jgi:signal transduction histidine kinase|nr:HAMP domain-containing protein [Oscillospiraceae bacterium]
MRGKFRTQLTFALALIVFVTVALISILANTFINMEFEKYAKAQQQSHANDIATNLSRQYNSITGKWNIEYIHGVGMSALYDGYLIRLMDLPGNVVWDAENHDMATCTQVMMDIISRMEKKRPGLSGGFVTQEYDLKPNGQKVGSVAIQYYGPYFLSESDFHFLDSLNLISVIVGSLALLCSVVVGGLLARRISRPIIKTAHIATQIAEGNYKIRFDGTIKSRELDELVAAVNHMAASLDNQEGLRKRLTTDVAHELRTPLTAVASHLEAMIEGLWEITPQRLQSCYEEIGRISGLVADLEQLAKVENENLRLKKSDVDLRTLINTVVGNFETESAKKNLSVSVDGTETHVNADKDRLNQVFANLLSNAIKYTPENGKIHVSIRDMDKNGVVMIEDSGIGIPEKDLPFIFERFYRADKSRSRSTGGAGIGLTIVKSIVSAHGGTIMAGQGGGQGSRFTVTLPKS